jgi:hypothetical protein
MAEFCGVGAVAAEGGDDALMATQTAVADLGVSDDEALAFLFAEAAAAPAPPDELFQPAFQDEEEMFDASNEMSDEWAREFILQTGSDEFQVDADAAEAQGRRDEMDATIRTGPKFFVTMYNTLTTDGKFGRIVDRVRQALFFNWERLGSIHLATGPASEPKYPNSRASSKETAEPTRASKARVKCDRCPASVQQHNFDAHRRQCKGSTVVDIYMYFLAILMGIPRCVRLSCVCSSSTARSCVWFASALLRSCMCACVLGAFESALKSMMCTMMIRCSTS